MSDLVGNPEDRFSHNEAHLCLTWLEISVFIAMRLFGKKRMMKDSLHYSVFCEQ